MTTPDCRLVVRELWRYPVKSIGGEQLTGCDVYETGFEGDRGWGVVDVATGTVLTARRAPELLFASARLRDGGEVEIQLPDGQVTDSSAVLSAWLQRDVRLDRASDEAVSTRTRERPKACRPPPLHQCLMCRTGMNCCQWCSWSTSSWRWS